MTKNVEFYKIDYEFIPLIFYSISEKELKNKFITSIMNSVELNNSYIIKQNKEKTTGVIIEFLETSSDYLFGVIGKLEDLKKGILKRLRSKENNTIIEPDNKEIDFYVENYTYFYIRFADLCCAVLSNSSAPKFRMHFRNYLREVIKIPELQSINIINVFDDNIEYKINKIERLHEIKMVFDDSSSIGEDILKLKDTFHISQSSLKEAKIDLNFTMCTVSDETRKLLKNTDVLKTDFKKLEIEGTGIDNSDIYMELIERILTKKIPIDIDEEYLKSPNDLDKIKEALAKSLPFYLDFCEK